MSATDTAEVAHILVVDDDEASQLLARTILERAGHAVHTAVDGESCLTLLATRTFEVVVLDLHLPGIDGLEVVERLRVCEAASGRRTFVIMVTADVREQVRERCHAVGADAYLTKPYRVSELLDLVEVAPSVSRSFVTAKR